MAGKNMRRIPRWLYAEEVVPIDDYIKLAPEVFRNDTIWPFNIEYLSIAGTPIYTDENASANYWWGGLGPRVDVEIGISGESDINLVPTYSSSVMSHYDPWRLARIQANNDNTPTGTTRVLKYPYRLPRDSGFHVKYRLREDLIGAFAESQDYIYKYPLSVIFHGVDVVTGEPVILGGSTENETYASSKEITLGNADLMNRGRHDVDIYDVVIQNSYPYNQWNAHSGAFTHVIINPIIGERWMPGSDLIPYGHLAPLSFAPLSTSDTGPQAYFFPEDTYLNRRQSMAVKIINPNETYVQPVSLALFGYLEVS